MFVQARETRQKEARETGHVFVQLIVMICVCINNCQYLYLYKREKLDRKKRERDYARRGKWLRRNDWKRGERSEASEIPERGDVNIVKG